MDEILKQIHYYAQQLKSINMWQAAGDYDYISSFLDSPRWNNGEYYGVVPRGENTIDEYSHNCPIPFTANRCLVSRCYDNDKALEILNKLSEIFSTLKSDVSGDGLTAINAYIENTNRYIKLLGGEPVPPGPVKEPILYRFLNNKPPEYIYGDSLIITLDKAKPIDHGEAHILDVSPFVLLKGKPIDHGEVEVITPEMMPMMAARMIDHGAVSVLDVELDRIVEPEPTPIIVEKTFLMSSSGVVTNVSLSYYVTGALYDTDGNRMSMEPGWFVTEAFYLSSTGLANLNDRIVHKTQVMVAGGAYMGIRNMSNYSVQYGVVICRKYEAKKAYFGRSTSSDYYVNYHTDTVIYDENGDKIPYDSAKKYTPSNTQSANGSWNTHNIARMVNVNGYLGYYSDTSGNACAIYYIEDVPTFTAYLNANKSESTLSPSYSYNWMLYSSKGVKKAGDGGSTFALVPPIDGMYLQASSGYLYLKGSPTSEITLASMTYTES